MYFILNSSKSMRYFVKLEFVFAGIADTLYFTLESCTGFGNIEQWRISLRQNLTELGYTRILFLIVPEYP